MQRCASVKAGRARSTPRPSAFVAFVAFFVPLLGSVVLAPSETQAKDDVWQDVEEFVVLSDEGKRDLLEAPESIVAFSGEELEQFGVVDVRDAIRLIPNTNTSPANRGNNGITIRGINSEGVSGPTGNLQPLAALVIDGATQSFAGLRRGARGVWDVQSFEVFRGPQSTLKGRNALAGSIVIETNDPTYYWEAAAQSAVGSFTDGNPTGSEPDRWDAAFVLSGPIIDQQLAFRVAGEIATQDFGIRSAVRGDARSEAADLDRATYRQIRGKLLAEPDFAPGLRGEFTVFYTEDDPGIPEVNEFPGDSPFTPRVEPRIAADRYTLVFEPSNVARRTSQVLNSIADLRYQINRDLRVESVSALTTTQITFESPFPLLFSRDETREDVDFTQDFRILYQPSDEVSILAGFFIASVRNEIDSFVNVALGTLQNQFTRRETFNAAGFVEARAQFWDQLTVTAGFRFDHDEYKTDVICRDPPGLLPPPCSPGVARGDTDMPLPRITVLWEPIVDQRIGFTFSRGYRSGFVSANSVVRPEFLWNYEASYRGSFFDGRVTVRANGFYYDWREIQVETGTPNVSVTENAGRARVYGIEAVLGLNPFEGFLLQGSFGYVNSEFEKFFQGPTRADFAGNEFPESPPHSFAILAAYEHPSGLNVSADYSWQDSFFATGDTRNLDFSKVDSYGTGNIRAGFSNDLLDFSVFLRNVMDKRYIVGRDLQGGVYVGPRRQIGTGVTIRFK
ncbi:MAG: TonB-dependent receptor [Myxococcota bacterium]